MCPVELVDPDLVCLLAYLQLHPLLHIATKAVYVLLNACCLPTFLERHQH